MKLEMPLIICNIILQVGKRGGPVLVAGQRGNATGIRHTINSLKPSIYVSNKPSYA